ncbi:MAG: hypothetical protein ABIZ56_10850 [Chthoniobacteraceae bacterium]
MIPGQEAREGKRQQQPERDDLGRDALPRKERERHGKEAEEEKDLGGHRRVSCRLAAKICARCERGSTFEQRGDFYGTVDSEHNGEYAVREHAMVADQREPWHRVVEAT